MFYRTQVGERRDLADSEKLMSDVVASIIEKILMQIGLQTYTRVSEILADHSLTFSDCYRNPDVLNSALKYLFGDSYLVTVEKIKTAFIGLDDENQNLAIFLQRLSQ